VLAGRPSALPGRWCAVGEARPPGGPRRPAYFDLAGMRSRHAGPKVLEELHEMDGALPPRPAPLARRRRLPGNDSPGFELGILLFLHRELEPGP